MRALKDIIPKALEGWKAEGDNRLKDLGSELKSLKMLVSNRVGSQTPATATGRPFGSGFGGGSPSGSQYSTGNLTCLEIHILQMRIRPVLLHHVQ